MPHQLTFALKHNYKTDENGITLPVILRSGDAFIEVEAKVDTGSQFCVFTREVGEALGLKIEAGTPQRMRSLHGASTFYGHEVTLETLGLEFQSFIFFSAEKNLPRNLLGRTGWLQLVRLAVIDYEQELYLSLYDETA
jgi:hypothetical protein